MSPSPRKKTAPAGLDLDQAFGLDEKAAVEGARIELADGVAIWVARMNNTNYATKLLKFYRANKFAIERNLVEENKADALLCDILAETIFVKMEGILHGGEALPDTMEKRSWAIQTYPMLREKVVEESQNFANFRAGELADEGKDSAPDSDGS